MIALAASLSLCAALAAGTPAQTGAPHETEPSAQSGSVTLPLEQLLPLLQPRAAAGKREPPAPALVTSAQLKGRLHADSLSVTARFEVAVLVDEWVEVPLLALGADEMVSIDSHGEEATVAVRQGRVVLVAGKAGTYPVQATISVRASAQGARRQISLPASDAAAHTPLRLEVDPAFELLDRASAGPAVDVLPRGGSWSVAWRAVAAPVAAKKPAERPPLEPAVPRATAWWVTTLEGRLELRVRYALRLDRPQPFALQLPEGARLLRAAVNGRPVAVQPAQAALQLEAAPSDVGASEGTIEVALAQELGVFHLSGALRLSLPRASWPIDEVEASAHLPAVFEYRREGGSLEAGGRAGAEKGAEALPGRTLRFRQYRVAASAPTVELSYSVDIEKSYFR